jgi:lysophospholipase L1-like esterase
VKLYVIGDSISVHYGPYLQRELEGFADYARKGGPDATGTDWENPTDANGGDSALVLAYLRENLPAISTDVLLLNCGLHDLRADRNSGAYQVPPDIYRAHLHAIIDLVQDAGIRPVWLSTTPVDDAVHNHHDLPYRRFPKDVLAYNAIAAEVMASHAVPTIDLHGFMQELGFGLTIDHVHYRDDIRARQAAFIATKLKALFPTVA